MTQYPLTLINEMQNDTKLCNSSAVRSGAKFVWHWRQQLQHRVSSDFCINIYILT